MSKWTEAALKARLRADLALDLPTRPAYGAAAVAAAAAAARRLEFHRIVAGIDSGAIAPDAAVALFDELSLVAA